jgi:Fe-S cluster assembly ATPase SufC
VSVLAIDYLRLRRGTREILRGVTMRVEQGELVALMGL